MTCFDRRARRALTVMALMLGACSGSKDKDSAPLDAAIADMHAAQDAAPLDAGLLDGAQQDGALRNDGGRLTAPVCPADAPHVDLAMLRTESIARLRALTGLSAGLDDGIIYFTERVSAADDCPFFDHTSLVYLLPSIPAPVLPELGLPLIGEEDIYGESWGLGVRWGLNGLPEFIYLNWRSGDGFEPAYFERMPYELLIAFPESMSTERREEIRDAIMGEFPQVAGHIEYSYIEDYVMIIDVASVEWESVEGSASQQQALRTLKTITQRLAAFTDLPSDHVELSTLSRRVPIIESTPFARVLEPTGDIVPECLRTFSAYNRDWPGAFVAEYSLPAPFGRGWVDNDAARECVSACFPYFPDEACWADAQP